MAPQQVFDKLRIPLGSLVVDGALVLFLAFTAGQMTNRFEAMDARLAAVEARGINDRLPERAALLEQRMAQGERDRAEILDALRRIETKLDSKQDKRP
jgi:hypothetical protein